METGARDGASGLHAAMTLGGGDSTDHLVHLDKRSWDNVLAPCWLRAEPWEAGQGKANAHQTLCLPEGARGPAPEADDAAKRCVTKPVARGSGTATALTRVRVAATPPRVSSSRLDIGQQRGRLGTFSC